jgi:hypothetical protein
MERGNLRLSTSMSYIRSYWHAAKHDVSTWSKRSSIPSRSTRDDLETSSGCTWSTQYSASILGVGREESSSRRNADVAVVPPVNVFRFVQLQQYAQVGLGKDRVCRLEENMKIYQWDLYIDCEPWHERASFRYTVLYRLYVVFVVRSKHLAPTQNCDSTHERTPSENSEL